MGDQFYFREDLLPISLLTVTEPLDSKDAEEIFAYYRYLCDRRIRFVALTDIKASAGMPDALTRKRFGELAAEFEPTARLWSLGSIVVVESSLIRGALKAIEWISKPSRPTTYAPDIEKAVSDAIDVLRQAGESTTFAIRDFHEQLSRAKSQATAARRS